MKKVMKKLILIAIGVLIINNVLLSMDQAGLDSELLHYANMCSYHSVDDLLKRGANPNAVCKNSSLTALHFAVDSTNDCGEKIKTMRQLLDAGAHCKVTVRPPNTFLILPQFAHSEPERLQLFRESRSERFNELEWQIACAVLAAEPDANYTIRSIHDVPEVCFRIAHQLEGQPLFDGSVWSKPCKVLALPNFGLCKIFEEVNNMASHSLSEAERWSVDCSIPPHTTTGHEIENALQFVLYSWQQRCPLSTLKQKYQEFIQSVSRGWVKSDPADFPDILHEADPSAWFLLVKKNVRCTENILIRFLAHAMLLNEGISCHAYWKKHPVGCEFRDTAYMWINKDCYRRVIEAFGLVDVE